ncbi:MAG: universal stress protein [Anaerolineae bacterium]|nr:universal stress protein [Anaerolineae bacterium]
MFLHLLVPLDGSHFAEGALAYAASLAGKYGSKITLVRVLPPGSYEWEAEMRAEVPELQDTIQHDEREDALAYLKRQEALLQAQGLDVSALILKNRAVAEAILEAAEQESADVIVMCSHGVSGVQRFLLGSVAERLIRHAPVDVLLVRPR